MSTVEIKEHKRIGDILNVTVNFIAEVITCIRDKDKRLYPVILKKLKNI